MRPEQNRFLPHVERLEDRQLLAAFIRGGNLFVVGTPRADNITVSDLGSTVYATINGREFTFRRSAVRQGMVFVFGEQGNDVINTTVRVSSDVQQLTTVFYGGKLQTFSCSPTCEQVISVGAYRAAAYDPATGREIWRVSYPVRFPDGFSNVMRPVYGAGLLFISGGFNIPSFIAVRPDGAGDVSRTHVAWTLLRGAPLTPSPLLVDNDLYIVSDNGIAQCLDARTGQTYWQRRLGGNYSASPVYADGRIYFLSEEGLATIVGPGHQFLELARNQLDGATLASIGISDGSVFIRSDTHLYRIGARTAR